MFADAEKICNLPANFDKEIIGAEAFIKDINDEFRYPIGYANNGNPAGTVAPDKSISNKWRVRLYRFDPGFFKSATFNNPTNAGWIIIKYLP